MTTIILAPDAVSLVAKAKPLLERGDWGDGVEAVCMMSALVPGSQDLDDCVTAGWPYWLAELCSELFDCDTTGIGGEISNLAEATTWVEEMAQVLSLDVDYDRVRDMFVQSLLKACSSLDQDSKIANAQAVLQQREGVPLHWSMVEPVDYQIHREPEPRHAQDITRHALVGEIALAAECAADAFADRDDAFLAEHFKERTRQRRSLIESIIKAEASH